jgi:hypothetical protein
MERPLVVLLAATATRLWRRLAILRSSGWYDMLCG